MFKRLFVTAALVAAAGTASATPIIGSFSIISFGGSYVGGTATTATGLDFGLAFASGGNGYGTNGTGFIGNATGAFLGLSGTLASITDIALGATADPFTANPFISFGANSPITVNFTSATYSRTSTSITVSGTALFTDGNPADTNSGQFALTTNGGTGQTTFTFTGNFGTAAPAATVPEPMSLALVGAGMVGLGIVRRRKVSGRKPAD